MDQLRALANPAGKSKPKTEKALCRKADAILARFVVELWIKVDIALEAAEKFRQVTRGRSSANTMYLKIVHWIPRIACSRDEKEISKSEVMDGIFPLATNTEPGCLRRAPCLQVPAPARKAPSVSEIRFTGRSDLRQKEPPDRSLDVRLFSRAVGMRPD
jgi:hypothetical protein